MAQAQKTSWRTQLLVACGVLLGSLLIILSPVGQAINNQTLDALFFLRGSQEAPKDLVIVAIDEPSFAAINQQWPWPRSLHADLLQALTEAGAKTVVFDIIFAEPSSPAEDQALAQALARHGNVVLAADIQTYVDDAFTQQVTVTPLPDLLSPGVEAGFVNIPVDTDGFVRKLNLFRNDLAGLSLQAAYNHLRVTAPAKVGNFEKTLSEEERYINFYGPSRSVKTVSYYQALDPEHSLPAGFFKDKLVFVGLLTQSAVDAQSTQPDYFPIPFSRFGQGYLAGVEIHAQTAANFLYNEPLRLSSLFVVIGVGLLGGLLSVPLFARLQPLAGGAALALFLLLVTGLGGYLFICQRLFWQLPALAIPALLSYGGNFGAHYYQNFREKRFIRKVFSTYLAPTVVNQLLDEPGRLKLGGDQLEVSILFLDIAGFTSLAEKLSPAELIDLLNQVLGEISGIVFQHHGMIDKYIGDAVMAVWGVPLGQENHAQNACRAALQIKSAIEAQNASGTLPATIGFRIGINSGQVVAGNVGGEQHASYTVLGDNVNLASRLEGVNQVYGTTIMVSESTRRELGDDFLCRYLDKVRVKGKSEAVEIYELLAEGEGDAAQRQEVTAFMEVVEAYRARRFTQAATMLLALNDQAPCRLYELYLERVAEFERMPPPEEWDGTTTFNSK